MNKKRILELACRLEVGELSRDRDESIVGFNMSAWHAEDRDGYLNSSKLESCGTVACIAGHACLLWAKTIFDDHFSRAARALDLTDDEAERLFIPWQYSSEFSMKGRGIIEAAESVTPFQAARVLRHLAETGIIDWSVMGSPGPGLVLRARRLFAPLSRRVKRPL